MAKKGRGPGFNFVGNMVTAAGRAGKRSIGTGAKAGKKSIKKKLF